MINPWLAILLVLTVLGAALATISLLSIRCALHPETSRKSVHIFMGLVTLSFPWLFAVQWPVLLLAALSMAALTGTRLISAVRSRFGNVLLGVERFSLGELYFPLAVALLFLLADGNRPLYAVPLLVLTLADATAALVGVRYGRHRYATSEGSKSIEGSLAFFGVAFFSAFLPLLVLGTQGHAKALLLSLIIGILVMLFEAISVGGLDNLFIPMGCYGLLKRYLTLDLDDLLFRLFAITLLAGIVFFWRRRTTLIESALMAAALVGYMNWALGGWQWLLVSLLLFLTYTRLWPGSPDNARPVHTVRAVAAMAAPGAVWLLTSLKLGQPAYLYPFIVTYAAHSVIIGMLQLSYACRHSSPLRRAWLAISRSWLVFLPFPENDLLPDRIFPATISAAAALPLLLICALLYLAAQHRLGHDEADNERWLGYALISLACSLPAALLTGWYQ